MLAIPPFWASSKNALLRANTKPPVELVVADLETIDRYTDGLVFTMQMQEIVETLSAVKTPKKDGKGNAYVEAISAHMPLLDAMQTASRKAFKRTFC